ncbi:MAG TPA: CPBP family intramembrane glutamic endopeptidase [Roseiflexaceae bacterium]|nr:CPBP family intramembrane glutamic endopeptidase [Roseiflexaceae bacterium]
MFLPLASLPLLLLFSARLGTTDLVLIGVIVETALAAGFTEEALFRGVVLRALEPRGLMQAAAISALLFGLFHAPGVLVGANSLIIGLQSVWAALFGFACATVVLVTDQIWPAVGIHFALNGISMLSSGKIIADERPDSQALIGMLRSGPSWRATATGCCAATSLTSRK